MILGVLNVSLSPKTIYFIFGDPKTPQTIQQKTAKQLQTYEFGKFEDWDLCVVFEPGVSRNLNIWKCVWVLNCWHLKMLKL